MGCKITQKKRGCKIAQLAKDRGKSAIKTKIKNIIASFEEEKNIIAMIKLLVSIVLLMR
jgi:hypothetical protein